jgi:cysteine sulfinate desulfinase/cysteine desulfurase-like protein
MFTSRLRSGDERGIEKLETLNGFFAQEFSCEHASFFDCSPYSIACVIDSCVSADELLAVSAKLPYFCRQAVELLKKQGRKIVEIEAKKDGSLCEKSLSSAKNGGVKHFFYSLVDEDTFFVEDFKKIEKYFDRSKIILDISNAVKRVSIPKVAAAFFWGYKLGGFKNSGVLLNDKPSNELLANVDLTVYEHLRRAYEAYKTPANAAYKREFFISKLQELCGEGFSLSLQPSDCLDNSFYARFEGIKARDFIRTLALEHIFITNGELCSLGLSKPSKILQTLGYSEDECRSAISFSFGNINEEEILFLASKIAFKYLQLKAIVD